MIDAMTCTNAVITQKEQINKNFNVLIDICEV